MDDGQTYLPHKGDDPLAADRAQAPAGAASYGAPTGPVAPATSWLRGAGWLSLATVLVSAANYIFSLIMARVLQHGPFVDFVAIQSLLLVLGTAVMAAVPWVVAREVALAAEDGRQDNRGLREALHFGVWGSLLQGGPIAILAALVGWHLDGGGLAAVAGAAGFALSLVAAPVGFLQGQSRFGAIAVLRLGEAALRVAVGLLLALVITGSPVGALIGFPVGSIALVAVGLLLCRVGFPLQRPQGGRVSVLVRQAAWLGSIQVVLTSLGAVDTIVAAAAGLNPDQAYAYQIAALLGRVPLFLAIALAQALFPSLSRAATETQVGHEMRTALTLFLRVAALALVVAWTIPVAVLSLVAPGSAPEVSTVLRFTSLTGVAVGLLTVVATAYQARSRYSAALWILAPAALAQPVVLFVAARFGVVSVAVAGAVLLTGTVVVTMVKARPWWWSPQAWRIVLPGIAVVGVIAVGVLLASSYGIVGWSAGVAVVTTLVAGPPLRGALGARRRRDGVS